MIVEIYNFFVFFAIGFAITLALTFGFGQATLLSFDYEKFSAYECGFDPFEETRFSFDIRFYLVAIFFIIFDLEVIFLFPLAINLPFLTTTGFELLATFVFFLFAGIIYEFWYGKLDWSLFSLARCLQPL